MSWKYKYTVLGLCTMAFFSTSVARLGISPVVPIITDDFAISNSLIGVALTGMWLTYALIQFPSGVLGDRFGERPLILVSVGGTTVACLLLAVSPAFSVFLLVVLVLGVFAGLHYSVATGLLGRTYDNLGFAVGVHTIGSSLAGLVAPIASAWIGTQYGWRPAVAFAVIVCGPTYVLFARRIRSTRPRHPDRPVRDQLRLEPLSRLLTDPQIAFTVAIAALCAFVWQGIASFLPAFVVEFRGHSATVAGTVFAAYFVVQAVAKPGVGSLSDRLGRDGVIFGLLGTCIFGLGFFVYVPDWPGMLGGLVLLGIGLSWPAAVEPRFMDHLDEADRGTGFGLVRTIFLVLGSLGSVGVGFFADRYGWAVAFGMLATLLTLAIVALVGNAVRHRVRPGR